MMAWASWTAKTIMLTAGFATVAGGGFATSAFAGTPGAAVTSGLGSVGGGNQVFAPITVPANVCGNALALLGLADARCRGGAVVRGHRGAPTMITSGSGSVLGGNQVRVPITAPVNACGNSVAVLGIAGAGCAGGSTVKQSAACGCQQGGGSGITSLLPVMSHPMAGLAAYDVPAPGRAGGDMSDATFFTLAGGVLLAGFSALKMSSRRDARRNVRGNA